MNEFLYLTSQSGKLMRLNTKSGDYDVLYQDPQSKYLFGLVLNPKKLYFSGQTVLGMGAISSTGFQVEKVVEFYGPQWDKIKRRVRKFWLRLGAYSRAVHYSMPDFHQMNVHNSSLYVSATGLNEVWQLDQELNLIRRIVIQPHIQDYHHLNNVFFDGDAFYVCLNRYGQQYGNGGYAKFDRNWNELERRMVGWESHGLMLFQGQIINLCSSSGSIKNVNHPHHAGLMVNGDLVFEHDPNKYFCKDISMDDERIYIVGGENKKREERGAAAGVIFILNRKYELLEERVIPGIGGLCGCRLPDVDYSNGAKI
jgi:hypothetical protein